MKIRTVALALGVSLLSLQVQADGHAMQIQKKLQKQLPPNSNVQVKDTPVPGLYEVTLDGQVFYLTGDGRYAFQGNLIDLKTRRNLTEPAKQKARVALLKTLPLDKTITYPAKGEQKREIWVFDDLDCPYCRKLHAIYPKLQAAGVTIHVLFYPRNGLGSDSYYGAIRVWCAQDRRKAFDEAMETGRVPNTKVCRHPVNEHLALAQKIGVTGTPFMVLDNGEVIPGYVPPKMLIEHLVGKR